MIMNPNQFPYRIAIQRFDFTEAIMILMWIGCARFDYYTRLSVDTAAISNKSTKKITYNYKHDSLGKYISM